MAPPKSKGKSRGDDLKQEEILQAILIADSFNVRFGPVTEKTPRALLPLMNVPMLDYILDYLSSQGVQETFIFCSHLSTEIRQHIRQSRYGEEGDSPMAVCVILAEGSHSMADGLRDINTRNLIRNDFFLLNCDTITNANLAELMAEHKQRRKRIRSAVMTMTCMKRLHQDPMRCAEDNILLRTDPATNQILEYQKVTLDKKLKVKAKHPDMVLHQDLLDGQLYICSPMVLNLFTDNFDYGTLDDFIHGIIISAEIFGNTVHVNELRNSYCARITNPYMYNVISQDIISRQTHPINPELINVSGEDDIKCHDRNVYHDPDLILPSTVELKRNVVIGKGTTIQPGTQIEKSVIGQNCTIGAGVKMQNCYLWGSVKIEDGCVLSHAILCDGVTVFANTTVQPQTILSWNVKVGPDIKLPQAIRLMDAPQKDEFGDDDKEEEVPDVTPEYGVKSKAFLYTVSAENSDDDDTDQFTTDWGEALIATFIDDDDDDDDDDVVSCNPSELDPGREEDDFGNFYSELIDTLRRAKDENIELEHVILEVNSLKHAYNIAIVDVHQGVVKVLVDMPLRQHDQAEGKELLTAVMRHVRSQLGLMKHYIKDRESQMDCLRALEDFAVENDRMLSVLSKVVQYLYDKDFLEEMAIVKWHDTEPVAGEEEEHSKIRKEMHKFVTWLQEAEEESDDD